MNGTSSLSFYPGDFLRIVFEAIPRMFCPRIRTFLPLVNILQRPPPPQAKTQPVGRN